MNSKVITRVLLILLTTTIIGCSINAEGTYSYKTLNNVSYTVNTKNLKYHSDIESVFLYFELIVNNKSDENIYIDIGKIKANLNGEVNTQTYYDSLASIMPKKEKLDKGKKVNKLYFVFSKNLRDMKLKQFKIVNFGLSEK